MSGALVASASTANSATQVLAEAGQLMIERMQPFLGEIQTSLTSVASGSKAASHVAPKQAACALVNEAVAAFLQQDLLQASLRMMEGARGSFGLCLSHSLDADSDFVVAARGQTMSVAFYPSQHLVVFGSEAAACKVFALPQPNISTPPLLSCPLPFTLSLVDCTRRSAWATRPTWTARSVSTLMM